MAGELVAMTAVSKEAATADLWDEPRVDKMAQQSGDQKAARMVHLTVVKTGALSALRKVEMTAIQLVGMRVLVKVLRLVGGLVGQLADCLAVW